jgi:hypothetical protein
MESLLDSFLQLFWAVWGLCASVGNILLPLVPLLLWIGFWMFAVDWARLRTFFLKGGWIGLVLLGVTAVLVWGMAAPPADGFHYMFGRALSNFVGKTVYVTGLICLMLLSGSVQLAGVFPNCCPPKPPDSLEGDSHH